MARRTLSAPRPTIALVRVQAISRDLRLATGETGAVGSAETCIGVGAYAPRERPVAISVLDPQQREARGQLVDVVVRRAAARTRKQQRETRFGAPQGIAEACTEV